MNTIRPETTGRKVGAASETTAGIGHNRGPPLDADDIRTWPPEWLKFITIPEIELEIRDVAVHQKGEARWAQLPAKPQTKDGTPVKDAVSGNVQYVTTLKFADRGVRDAFSQAVIRAVLEHAPQVFDAIEVGS